MLGVEGPGKYKAVIILEEALCGGKEGRYKTCLRNASGEGRILANCEVAGCNDILKRELRFPFSPPISLFLLLFFPLKQELSVHHLR